MKKFLIVLSFWVAFYANANSNWIFVTINDEATFYYIDRNSIQKSGDSITFWNRENLKQRDEFGNLSYKNQVTMNCRTRERISRFIMSYDDLDNNGKLTDSFIVPNAKWKPIPPDSVNWEMMKIVCRK
jgi:hypothetical protein